MVRPRFHKLAVARQEHILNAALSEFAAHGFADASLNRIIDAAGISKGSMYYYFDGKEDLYTHVIRDRLERLLGGAGPFPVPPAGTPDEFWSSLTELYLRLMKVLLTSPEVAALLRGWLSGGGAPSVSTAQQEAEQATLPWLLGTLAVGQEIGAVRTDLPTDLLLALVMSLGQVIDIWLIRQPPASADLDRTVRTLIDVIRRAVAPD
ncbi:TetR/AcrR family transcriptional regulator [Lysinimonas soli]|uniref:TetR/AcrR family transcriptional regulator n=1 Tax=Lysinimonas soli TaxID=1074233 RepID=A0ABW0NST5_9MICO